MYSDKRKIYNNLEACYLLSIGKKMRKTTWSESDYLMFDDNGELVDESGRYEDWDFSQGDKWQQFVDEK